MKKITIFTLIILPILLIATACDKNESNETEIQKPEKSVLEEELSDLLSAKAIEFYENFYYANIGNNDEERASKVAKYEKNGIKVDYENLTQYNKDYNSYEKLHSYNCSTTLTKAVIYPVAPYTSKDYIIQTELICDDILSFYEYKSNGEKTATDKDILLENAIIRGVESLAREYYNRYYEQHENNSEDITVKLSELKEYNNDKVSSKLLNKCNEETTFAKISPRNPYVKNDIDIKVKVVYK